MFTLTADIQKCITSSVSVRGDEKGDEKGDVSPRHPHIVFDHLQTIKSTNMKKSFWATKILFR